MQRGWMEGVRAEQERDQGGGLLARLEIKMNMRGRRWLEGVGGMVSVLYRAIKKTSRAAVSFFLFFNTCSSFSARTEGGA